MRHKAIPQHILSAVNAILAPYGASFSQTATENEEKKYMTTKEASKYIGFHPKYLRILALNGEIEVIRTDYPMGKLLFEKHALDNWLEKRNAMATAKMAVARQ